MDILHSAARVIDPSWSELIGPEFDRPYMKSLGQFLQQEYESGQAVFPPVPEIFSALQSPLDDVRVVILGQDPYHSRGQANGLAFSVHQGVKIPPSLRNIYKEIFGGESGGLPRSGDLTSWARQGVLLLNATLTVREAAAGSHQKRGWEDFTDFLIRTLSQRLEHVVFLLWGSHAQKKAALIDSKKHFILESPHPSPLSAHRGFLGNGHFTKANEYLERHGRTPIDWQAVKA